MPLSTAAACNSVTTNSAAAVSSSTNDPGASPATGIAADCARSVDPHAVRMEAGLRSRTVTISVASPSGVAVLKEASGGKATKYGHQSSGARSTSSRLTTSSPSSPSPAGGSSCSALSNGLTPPGMSSSSSPNRVPDSTVAPHPVPSGDPTDPDSQLTGTPVAMGYLAQQPGLACAPVPYYPGPMAYAAPLYPGTSAGQRQQFLWLAEEAHRQQQLQQQQQHGYHQTRLALSQLALGQPVVVASEALLHQPEWRTSAGNPSPQQRQVESTAVCYAPVSNSEDTKTAPQAAAAVYLPTGSPNPVSLLSNGPPSGQLASESHSLGPAPPLTSSAAIPYGVAQNYQPPEAMVLNNPYCLPTAPCDPALATGWSTYPPHTQPPSSPPNYWYLPQTAGYSPSLEMGFGGKSASRQPGVSESGAAVQQRLAGTIPSGGGAPPMSAGSPNSLLNGYRQWTWNPAALQQFYSTMAAYSGGGNSLASYYYPLVAALAGGGAQAVGYNSRLNQSPTLLCRGRAAGNQVAGAVPRFVVSCKEFDQHELRSLNLKVNPRDFDESLLWRARYFVIKSDCEDNVHQSIRHGVWCSTRSGNQCLNEAYLSSRAGCLSQSASAALEPPTGSRAEHPHMATTCVSANGHILLFFSIRSSGYFAGVAEMTGPVEANKQLSIWRDSRFRGKIPVRWLYVKNVPNQLLRHICVESYENRSVTLLRDTSEVVPASKGEEMLRIIHNYGQQLSQPVNVAPSQSN